MFKRILVAYDGSDHATRALDTAIDLSVKFASRLEIVQVESHPTASSWVTEIGDSGQGDMSRAATRALSSLWSKAQARGVREIGGDILYGEPAHEIARYAKDNAVDLVVMGRRGLGRVGGLVLGSVSTKIAGEANCAVLTVR